MQRIVLVALDFVRIIEINEIGSQQFTPTKKVLKLTSLLLDHVSNRPNSSITCKKSDMQHWMSSDYSYLTESKDHSHAG